MDTNTVLEIVNLAGVGVAAFCGWKAHRSGKLIPDLIDLVKDEAKAEVDSNFSVKAEAEVK